MSGKIKIECRHFDIFDHADVVIGPLTVIEGKSSTGKSRLLKLIETVNDAIDMRKMQNESAKLVEDELINAIPLRIGQSYYSAIRMVSVIANLIAKTEHGPLPSEVYDMLEALSIDKDVADHVFRVIEKITPEAYATTAIRCAGFKHHISIQSPGKNKTQSVTISNEESREAFIIDGRGVCGVPSSPLGLFSRLFVINPEFIKVLHSAQSISRSEDFATDVVDPRLRVIESVAEESNPYVTIRRKSSYSDSSYKSLADKTGVGYISYKDSLGRFLLRANIRNSSGSFREDVGASSMSDSETFIALVQCLIHERVICEEFTIIIDSPEAFADCETVNLAIEALLPVAADTGCNIAIFTRTRYRLPDSPKGAARYFAKREDNGIIIEGGCL